MDYGADLESGRQNAIGITGDHLGGYDFFGVTITCRLARQASRVMPIVAPDMDISKSIRSLNVGNGDIRNNGCYRGVYLTGKRTCNGLQSRIGRKQIAAKAVRVGRKDTPMAPA